MKINSHTPQDAMGGGGSQVTQWEGPAKPGFALGTEVAIGQVLSECIKVQSY